LTRILIVDDELEQARALARQFSEARPELTVVTSGNGQQAMDLMQSRGFELVLTDVRTPGAGGLQLLSWLQQHRPDVAAFSMSASGNAGTADLVIEHFDKPVDAQAVLRSFHETLHGTVRGHVQHVSLASFLQLLEMERKTCTLTVACAEKVGTLSVRQGALVAARAGDLHGQEAAIAIVAWPYPNITITRRCDEVVGGISSPLGFIVMEAMRVQDEALRHAAGSNGIGSVWPSPQRTWRPTNLPSERPPPASARPSSREWNQPSGARAFAVVETETGKVLYASARDDSPVGELARLAAQLLLQEAETLRLCNVSEGVEELVLSTSSRCDVIRPLSAREFALLVFAPEETNLVMARLELEYFIAAHARP
jgi:CheY-like chemotaxis protein